MFPQVAGISELLRLIQECEFHARAEVEQLDYVSLLEREIHRADERPAPERLVLRVADIVVELSVGGDIQHFLLVQPEPDDRQPVQLDGLNLDDVIDIGQDGQRLRDVERGPDQALILRKLLLDQRKVRDVVLLSLLQPHALLELRNHDAPQIRLLQNVVQLDLGVVQHFVFDFPQRLLVHAAPVAGVGLARVLKGVVHLLLEKLLLREFELVLRLLQLRFQEADLLLCDYQSLLQLRYLVQDGLRAQLWVQALALRLVHFQFLVGDFFEALVAGHFCVLAVGVVVLEILLQHNGVANRAPARPFAAPLDVRLVVLVDYGQLAPLALEDALYLEPFEEILLALIDVRVLEHLFALRALLVLQEVLGNADLAERAAAIEAGDRLE